MKEQIIGLKFNRLTIIGESEPTKSYKRRVICLCDCGKEIIAELYNIKINHTKSCGCLNNELRKNRTTTHGMAKIPEYKSYNKMLERCYNENDISYKNYGGRGIYVCERWKESFENFIKDMGRKPSPLHSIERANTNGIYEPDNCFWATKKEQNNNRSNNTILEYKGIKKTQQQWAEELDIGYSKIIFHMRRGISFEQIVDYCKKYGGQRLQFRVPSRKYWPRKAKTS